MGNWLTGCMPWSWGTTTTQTASSANNNNNNDDDYESPSMSMVSSSSHNSPTAHPPESDHHAHHAAMANAITIAVHGDQQNRPPPPSTTSTSTSTIAAKSATAGAVNSTPTPMDNGGDDFGDFGASDDTWVSVVPQHQIRHQQQQQQQQQQRKIGDQDDGESASVGHLHHHQNVNEDEEGRKPAEIVKHKDDEGPAKKVEKPLDAPQAVLTAKDYQINKPAQPQLPAQPTPTQKPEEDEDFFSSMEPKVITPQHVIIPPKQAVQHSKRLMLTDPSSIDLAPLSNNLSAPIQTESGWDSFGDH